jgi:hypothetical protein
MQGFMIAGSSGLMGTQTVHDGDRCPKYPNLNFRQKGAYRSGALRRGGGTGSDALPRLAGVS